MGSLKSLWGFSPAVDGLMVLDVVAGFAAGVFLPYLERQNTF